MAGRTNIGRPRVAIACDRIEYAGHAAHRCLHGYVEAVSRTAGALPLLIPAELSAVDIDSLLDEVDGILLPGSPSNVAAQRYGQPPLPPTTAIDLARDDLSLALIPQALRRGVPLLGICRGLQEMNVAAGGTLEPSVHLQSGRMDHREGAHERAVAQWYEDRHAVELAPGGLLHRLLGASAAQVNSLHHQGIQRLGRGLRIEAHAPDGLVEAFSVADAPAFALAVQWHPEMRVDDSPLARRIFEAFGDACREHRKDRMRASAPEVA